MASISINNNLNKVLIFLANSSWYLFNFRLNTLKAFINNGYKAYGDDTVSINNLNKVVVHMKYLKYLKVFKY